MYVADWVEGHRPFTWATDEDIEQPVATTMGRFMTRGASSISTVEPVSYHWYTAMKQLATTPIDDLSIPDESYDATVNATWRAMHADEEAIDGLILSILHGHQDRCSPAVLLTARRFLAALPAVSDDNAERITHGALVAAEAHHASRRPDAVATKYDCAMFSSYDGSSVNALERIPSYTVECIYSVADTVAPTTTPTHEITEREA